MRAQVLECIGEPLRLLELEPPQPGPGQIRLRVRACAVCRTDLHVVDGDLPGPKLPLIPGHEIVGEVDAVGPGVTEWQVGERAGVPWLGWTCGTCGYCRSGRENLCDAARFTGYQIDGGYAEYTVAEARFCFRLPASFSDLEAAPLLCAGLIGYRSLRAAGDGAALGLYGFGAAAHIVAQVAQEFALTLGAEWAGASDQAPPEPLDAAIIYAPVGPLIPAALRVVKPGGRVVCAGIHMTDIPSFPYAFLWGERSVSSVANLTRRDGEEFLALAPRVPVMIEVQPFPLEQANAALDALRHGRLRGAAVLTVP
jgi:propanol-preferring alcohol dehydrogenase